MVKEILYRRAGMYPDTRFAKTVPTKLDLLIDSKLHIDDVRSLGNIIIKLMQYDIGRHDWTKITYIDDFHDDFKRAINSKANFTDLKWFSKVHINEEPHHCMEYTGPQEIMLYHFEHLCCDWVAASKTRNEDKKLRLHDYDEEAFKNKLYEAFKNQLKLLDQLTQVRDLPENLRVI